MQKSLSVNRVVSTVLNTFRSRQLRPVALETGTGKNADVLRALCLATIANGRRTHRSSIDNVREYYGVDQDFVDGLMCGWDNQASSSNLAKAPKNTSNSYRRGFNCGRTAYRRVNAWLSKTQAKNFLTKTANG